MEDANLKYFTNKHYYAINVFVATVDLLSQLFVLFWMGSGFLSLFREKYYW